MELALDAALAPPGYKQPQPVTGQTDTPGLQPDLSPDTFSAADNRWMQQLGIRLE